MVIVRKSLVFVVMILFFSSFGLSMSESVTVKTDSENEVKVYVWPDGGGQLLNLDKGAANEAGFFSTTFFSLNEPLVRFQILVVDSKGQKIKDVLFDSQPIDKAILFDCTVSTKCNVSYGEVLTELEKEVEDIGSELKSEPIPELEEVEEFNPWTDFSFKERLDFQGAYVNFLIIVGGVLTFLLFLFMWFRFEKLKNFLIRLNYFSEEGELLRLEKKIQHKDNLISRFNEGIKRKNKIKKARSKLNSKSNKLKGMIKLKIKKVRGKK